MCFESSCVPVAFGRRAAAHLRQRERRGCVSQAVSRYALHASRCTQGRIYELRCGSVPLALREDGELLALAGERDALTLRRLPGRRYHEERQLLWLSEKMAGVQLRTSPRVLNRYPDEAFLSAQLVRHAIKARTSVSKLGLDR